MKAKLAGSLKPIFNKCQVSYVKCVLYQNIRALTNKKCPHLRWPIDIFKARALFPYAPQNEGELSAERGDIVSVLEKPDPQWWRVRSLNGAVGMLPATYLEEYVEGQALAEGTHDVFL